MGAVVVVLEQDTCNIQTTKGLVMGGTMEEAVVQGHLVVQAVVVSTVVSLVQQVQQVQQPQEVQVVVIILLLITVLAGDGPSLVVQEAV
jgi:hypothetical protein